MHQWTGNTWKYMIYQTRRPDLELGKEDLGALTSSVLWVYSSSLERKWISDTRKPSRINVEKLTGNGFHSWTNPLRGRTSHWGFWRSWTETERLDRCLWWSPAFRGGASSPEGFACLPCTTHLSHQRPIGVESLAFPLSQGSFILLHKFLGLPG